MYIISPLQLFVNTNCDIHHFFLKTYFSFFYPPQWQVGISSVRRYSRRSKCGSAGRVVREYERPDGISLFVPPCGSLTQRKVSIQSEVSDRLTGHISLPQQVMRTSRSVRHFRHLYRVCGGSGMNPGRPARVSRARTVSSSALCCIRQLLSEVSDFQTST